MIRFVIWVMVNPCFLYIVLQVLADKEVVQLGHLSHLVHLAHAGEVDLVLLPEGEEVQLVQHLLDCLCGVSSTGEISVDITGPDYRAKLSLT